MQACSFFKDMNLQSSFTRVGHRAAKFQTRTEGSLMPTICLEGVSGVRIQINVLTIVGPFVSRVQLSIPPVLVKVIIKRNREHHSKCFADAWNVVGHDSDNSRCDWSRGLARSVNYGIPCGKQKKINRTKETDHELTVIELVESLTILICQWQADQLLAKVEG